MQTGEGLVREVYLSGAAAARLDCPPGLVPGPGQFLLASLPEEADAPLGVALFASAYTAGGFLASADWPAGWVPGARLRLRGPLGRGFRLPEAARRVALAAPWSAPGRVLALAEAALAQGAAVTLISASAPAGLLARIEVQPPAGLPEAAAWSDYLALDLPRARLERIGRALGLGPGAPLPAGQALVGTDLACGGLAACGLCAVPTRRGPRLACLDGPVFALGELTPA